MRFFDTASSHANTTHTRTMDDIRRRNKLLVGLIAAVVVLNIVLAAVFPHGGSRQGAIGPDAGIGQEQQPEMGAAPDPASGSSGNVVLVPLDDLIDATDPSGVARVLPKAAAPAFEAAFKAWLAEQGLEGAAAFIDSSSVEAEGRRTEFALIVIDGKGAERTVDAVFDSGTGTFSFTSRP